MSQDLPQRLFVNGLSTVLIAFFIFFAEFPPMKWVFASVISIIVAIALWEYYQIVKKKHLFPATALGILFAILYVFSVFIKTQGPYPYRYLDIIVRDLPVIILALAFLGCFIFYALYFRNPIIHISTTFLGLIYIAVPLALFVNIMYFFTYAHNKDPYHQGSWWTAYLIAVTKAADMGGYFIGRRFGKHKLALKLSPNKTLEGFLAGLFASILMSLLICFLGKKFGSVFENFSYTQSVLLGFIIGILGQIGDLAESLLKRDASVKDSNMIPGVGGVLDMIDSLLFTAPIVYIYLRIFHT